MITSDKYITFFLKENIINFVDKCMDKLSKFHCHSLCATSIRRQARFFKAKLKLVVFSDSLCIKICKCFVEILMFIALYKLQLISQKKNCCIFFSSYVLVSENLVSVFIYTVKATFVTFSFMMRLAVFEQSKVSSVSLPSKQDVCCALLSPLYKSISAHSSFIYSFV